MAVLVDSNVLLDVMTGDPRWSAWSEQALAQAAERARLVINAIVFAEISVNYATIDEVEDAFPAAMIERERLPYEAAFLAAKAYAIYRKRGGIRTSPLPDFFIGAHAAVAGYELLTRDAARYRSYFPKLALIAPG